MVVVGSALVGGPPILPATTTTTTSIIYLLVEAKIQLLCSGTTLIVSLSMASACVSVLLADSRAPCLPLHLLPFIIPSPAALCCSRLKGALPTLTTTRIGGNASGGWLLLPGSNIPR